MTPARNVPIETWHNGFYGESFYFTADTVGTPVDLTGYAGKLQVRQYGAQPGSAVITLGNVGSAVEGVWIAEPTFGIIEIRFEEVTLRAAYLALSGQIEPGAVINLVQDLVLTNPQDDDEVWFTGEFNLNAGSTQ